MSVDFYIIVWGDVETSGEIKTNDGYIFFSIKFSFSFYYRCQGTRETKFLT
jgi:hypothetical protein